MDLSKIVKLFAMYKKKKKDIAKHFSNIYYLDKKFQVFSKILRSLPH
jgi:hypothetical protein